MSYSSVMFEIHCYKVPKTSSFYTPFFQLYKKMMHLKSNRMQFFVVVDIKVDIQIWN